MAKAKITDGAARMGSQALLPLLLSMAGPGILSSLTAFLYMNINRKFVGDFVGPSALGVFGVMNPITNIVTALSLFITVGGASMLSLSLGRGDRERADRLFTNIVLQSVGMAGILSAVFLLFKHQLVAACGAAPGSEIYGYAVEYLEITAWGQVPNLINVGLASVIRAQGNTRYSMMATLIGAFVNVGLNFVVVAGMPLSLGVRGAAMATVASQTVGALVSIAYFAFGKSPLRFLGLKAASLWQMLSIAKMGIAPSIFQMLSFVYNLIINRALQNFGALDARLNALSGGRGGDLALSIFTVVATLDGFVVTLGMGVNQAASPIISYNYGARRFARVRKASLLSQGLGFIFAIGIWLLAMLAPEPIFRFFGIADPELLRFGASAMRLSKPFLLFGIFQMLVSMYFSGIGKPEVATLVSLSRSGVFLIPGLLIFPRFFGLDGVFYANPVSDCLSLLVVGFLYYREMRRLSSLEEGEAIHDKGLIRELVFGKKRKNGRPQIERGQD
ncbi:MAG: MATE family efflux transporter [Christensenellaceae bacterium]|jgi:Na+-driven multidrug efflux pump|nr:MATE family efflux transporter [Christensenellaceae bacterium]